MIGSKYAFVQCTQPALTNVEPLVRLANLLSPKAGVAHHPIIENSYAMAAAFIPLKFGETKLPCVYINGMMAPFSILRGAP